MVRDFVRERYCRIPRRDVTAFDSVIATVASWNRIDGSERLLTAEFCRRFGYAGAYTTGSGRDGLRGILRVVKGRVTPRAWVPSWTIPAVARIFEDEGFEVRFVDVDPATLCLTPAIVERQCVEPGLLLVTHYFGLPADMKNICRVAARRGLKIVEDCAHTPCTPCCGRPVGSFGLAGFLSFETRKPLNGLGGGMIVTNNAATETALTAAHRVMSNGFSRDLMKLVMTSSEWAALRRPVFSLAAPALYARHPARALVSFYRLFHARGRSGDSVLSDLQSALVLSQLDDLEAAIDHKRGLASVYDRNLPAAFSRPLDPAQRPHGYYMYVTTHPEAEKVGRRLRDMGIDCGIGPEVLQRCDTDGSCPGAAELLRTAIELPMYSALTPADCERVCAAAYRALR